MTTIATTFTLLLEILVMEDILVENGKGKVIIPRLLMDTGEEGTAGTQVVVGEQEIFHDLSTEKTCTIVIHPTDQ